MFQNQQKLKNNLLRIILQTYTKTILIKITIFYYFEIVKAKNFNCNVFAL